MTRRDNKLTSVRLSFAFSMPLNDLPYQRADPLRLPGIVREAVSGKIDCHDAYAEGTDELSR